MMNSNNLITDFIESLHFSSVYVEDNFPLEIESSFRIRPDDAADYLINSARVGNKVAGFFHKVPFVDISVPLRSMCIFISTALPDTLTMPTFFCKNPDDLTELFPKAAKVSADMGIPVQVVISHNILNNYLEKGITAEAQDRVTPYLSPTSASHAWDPSARMEKLAAACESVWQSLPLAPAKDEISFARLDSYFPSYLFPVRSEAQRSIFAGVNKIRTTGAEAEFVLHCVRLMGLDTEVTEELELVPRLSKPLLCPGCPFMAIFSVKDIGNYAVFSSVRCPALASLHRVAYMTYAGYRGLVSEKINIPTLFIGSTCDMGPVQPEHFANGKVIALLDKDGRAPLPVFSAAHKIKHIQSGTFSYGCKNIRRGAPMRLSVKKCNCIKNGKAAACAEKTHCAALYEGMDTIKINSKLCSGCKVCALHCPSKALS